MKPDLKEKSHIIFDFDGTIGTLQIDWKPWNLGVGEIYRSFDPSFDRHLKGERVHTSGNDFFKRYGQECRDRTRSFNGKYELERTTSFVPNEEALKFIRGASGSKLYVWSSNARATVQKHLGELGILGKFQKLVTDDDVFYLKPNLEGFALIASGAPLKDYVMIGDSSFDRDAALGAGIDFVDIVDLL